MNKYFEPTFLDYKGYRWHFIRSHKDIVIVSGRISGTEELVLIRQFRPPVGKWVISFPTGAFLREVAKQPSTAKTEAESETGLKVIGIQSVGEFARAPGLTDETVHLYEAEYSKDWIGQNLDHIEDIQTLIVKRESVFQKLSDCRNSGDLIDICLLPLMLPRYLG